MIINDNILNNFNKINIWSDGGKHHFKQNKTMWWFSSLPIIYHKEFIWNFFASYHGHSLCDAHTGVGKLFFFIKFITV